MADDDDEVTKVMDVARRKNGLELFRELLRHFPIADIEDYHRAGMWRNEKLKADIVLICAHRMEAGAADPVDLEDVPMPQLPSCPWGMMNAAVAKGGAAAPVEATAASAAVNSGLVELRALSLFVAKWKLEPVKTKQTLAKLHPARRRQLISGFKTEHLDGGPEASDDLDKYIQTLDETVPLPEVPGNISSGAAPPAFMKAAMPMPGQPGVLPPAISAIAAAEMRLITLFVAKFKLEVTRTKALLGSVPVNKRALIISTFNCGASEGVEAMDKLEQFIKESNDNSDGTGNGLKRPASAMGAVENGDSKRPAFVLPPKFVPPA